MRKTNIIVFIIALLMILSTTSTEAAKIDVYRNALLNKSFTLKYEIITPQGRRTNKEFNFFKDDIFGGSYIRDTDSSQYERKLIGGIIVVEGDDKYIEQTFREYEDTTTIDDINEENDAQNLTERGFCSLLKDGDFFKFYYTIRGGEKKYFAHRTLFGTSKNVKANDKNKDKDINPYDNMIDEYNYGSPELAQVLMPILPLDKVFAMPNTPIYQFITSGTLDNGLTFEDFAGSKNNTHYAVRYYFSGDKLVKIYAINYIKNAQGIQSYEKVMINITEFSITPDSSYLSLPEGLRAKK